MAAAPTERELKLEADDKFVLPDLGGIVAGGRVEDDGEVELDATYYDTQDRRLLRRGVTLRHRTGEAPTGTWTLKVPVTGTGGTLDRTELEWVAPADQRPGAADQLTIGVRAGRPLAVIGTLRTRRHRRVLRDAEGRSLAEIDDDHVTATTPSGPVAFREIEVELTGGTPALAAKIGAALEKRGAKANQPQPKLQRVLGPEGEPPAALDRSSTLGEVALASIAAALDRLLTHDPAVRLQEDPEAVHQARVATRRLRSDLRLLKDLFDEEWMGVVRPALRDVARTLGEVRDLDVQLERVEAAEAGTPVEQEGVSGLAAQLRRQRHEAADRLATLMDGVAYTNLIERLLDAAANPPWRETAGGGYRHGHGGEGQDSHGQGQDGHGHGSGHGSGGRRRPRLRPDKPARRALPRLLRRRWRKVRKSVTALSRPPAPAELHAVRKRSKELRYNAELATPVLGPPAARLAAAAEDLQDLLGQHHDAVVAGEWLHTAAASGTRPKAFAAGQLAHAAQLRRAQVEEAWPEVWERLADKELRRAVW
ncbi:MAG TPA: CYTH and CHAD domain-containing protein [Acidimicrobiales bacterium]|nr:CYTH and CHAD domain-containing protein [Acidimicrobiales bacterium]